MPRTTKSAGSKSGGKESEFFAELKAALQDSLASATYTSFVLPASFHSFDGDVLTIKAPSSQKREVLEKRLRPQIERQAAYILKRDIKVRFVDEDSLRLDQVDAKDVLVLQGMYESLRDEIIKADRVFVATQYFRRKWVPRLGHTLAWTIIALRQRAYYNRDTQEKRDEIKSTLEEIAYEIGTSVDTIQRALKKPCTECDSPHPIADHFIPLRKAIYTFSPRFGKKIRSGTFFRVRMDDPLIRADRDLIANEIGFAVDDSGIDFGEVIVAEKE